MARPTQASATPAGLTQGLTYNYRFVVGNANGTVIGRQKTFVPSSVPGLGEQWASDVHSDSVLLHSEITPGGAPTSYSFEFGSRGLLDQRLCEFKCGSGWCRSHCQAARARNLSVWNPAPRITTGWWGSISRERPTAATTRSQRSRPRACSKTPVQTLTFVSRSERLCYPIAAPTSWFRQRTLAVITLSRTWSTGRSPFDGYPNARGAGALWNPQRRNSWPVESDESWGGSVPGSSRSRRLEYDLCRPSSG